MDFSSLLQSLFGSPAPAAVPQAAGSPDDALRRQIAESIINRTQIARDQPYPAPAPIQVPSNAGAQAQLQGVPPDLMPKPQVSAPPSYSLGSTAPGSLRYALGSLLGLHPSGVDSNAAPQNMLAAQPAPQTAMLMQPQQPQNITVPPSPLSLPNTPPQINTDPTLPQNAPVPTPAPPQGSPLSAALLSPTLADPNAAQLQAPADPWAKLLGVTPLNDAQAAKMGPFPAAPNAPDPMTTASTDPSDDPWGGMRQATQNPAPSPQAALTSAAAASPSIWQKYQNFTKSDRGQALNAFFTGLAMGKTPQQSLAYGARMVSATAPARQKRDQVNQTAQWLQGKGMSPQDAALLASNPTALADYLKTSLTPTKPVSVGAGSALVDPSTGKVIYQAPQTNTYHTLSDDEAKKMGLPEGGTYQVQPNGHITKIGGSGLAGGDLSQDDAHSMAASIIDGTMDPNLPGFYHNKAAVYAEVKKIQPDFNIAKAAQTYKADARYFGSMNSSQQIRIRQNMDTLSQSLPMVKQLADQWDAGGFKPLNAATLAVAVQGGLGQKAQSIATQLQHQISQVNAELAGVFMGGNSPTDAAFKLAQHSLSGDWSAQTLRDNLKLIDENLRYRRNALTNAGAVEPGNTTSYGVPPHTQEATPPAVPAYQRGGPAEAIPGATPNAAPAKVNSKTDYDALPSGTLFIAPDGTTRKKP